MYDSHLVKKVNSEQLVCKSSLDQVALLSAILVCHANSGCPMQALTQRQRQSTDTH